MKLLKVENTKNNSGVTLLLVAAVFVVMLSLTAQNRIEWDNLSTTTGDLPASQIIEDGRQVGTLILDIDRDGYNDFVISGHGGMVWYRFNPVDNTWDRYVLDNAGGRSYAAGGTATDIDLDGDLDIVQGGPQNGHIYWWENPYPEYHTNATWTRRVACEQGIQHHDQLFGDFDGDYREELVFLDNRGKQLILSEIPEDPAEPWKCGVIAKMEGNGRPEGLAGADINGDGKTDIVGGGWWFEHLKGDIYKSHPVNPARQFTRSAAGDLVEGGAPEILLGSGDGVGPLEMYEWDGTDWIGTILIDTVDHGHSLDVGDVDGNGHLDIFTAEMHTPGRGAECKAWMLFGNGMGDFTIETISTGIGNHESKLGDLDSDGDLDILSKDYQAEIRTDVWLNNGTRSYEDEWETHFIDALPARSTYIETADLDGDGDKDLAAGGFWWGNPGDLAGNWKRSRIGEPLNNLALVYDFDQDGDQDILGTRGVGSDANHQFVWARNTGQGEFEIFSNIDYARDGDFLQGVLIDDFGSGLQVVLSWHDGEPGTMALNVPGNPSARRWTSSVLADVSLREDIAAGDIDNDGDPDLLLGTIWLQNDAASWEVFTLGDAVEGEPDRVDLADIDGDGDLDAIVGLENGRHLYWFEVPDNPTRMWNRHVIANVPGQGFSMDVADFDQDGDPDVVVGEHRGEGVNRVLVFLNGDSGQQWTRQIADSQPTDSIDHHDGTPARDMDGDGDLDIISIGWYNPKVWVFENK